MESLLRRLQAIVHEQGNHTTYQPEELLTQMALYMAKIIKGELIQNIHEGLFYLAHTVLGTKVWKHAILIWMMVKCSTETFGVKSQKSSVQTQGFGNTFSKS